ncbi:MAG: VWA domain-containing protein [Pleurocapsa minor HA4230-MV1]|jgi:uncharacterized repeat protein (TIGR01451 family)|nr:VWA domain-containing protein [Pleurocapsa minor HA4230-MV1]
MNNQLSIQRKASFHFGLVLFASLGFALPALSEGSQQLGNGTQGLNVYLFEYNATNGFVQANQGPRPIKVNVENANQVINISLCGWSTTDLLSVEVFRPSGTEINYTTQVAAGSPGAFNAAAADGAGAWRVGTGNARTTTQTTLCTNQNKPSQPTGTLSNSVRFIAPEAGTYEIRLYNDTLAAGDTNNVFTYFDVTVTPNALTNPDPRANNGQVWATSWAFNAGNAFTTAGAYDADLYIRTPGGRTNTEFIWQLDLNRFAPQRHEIIANGIGLNAPNSRGSVPGTTSGAAYTKSYPIYLSPPNSSSFIAPILPEPAPASVSNISFIDNAGQDNTISPTTTSSVQDSGFFRFNSDVAGTYKIVIDTNQNGVFGAGDRILFGSTTSGVNAVAWDGRGDNNTALTPGSYPAQISVVLGEYHFVTFDAETSGGGTNDGLSIWKWNGSSRSAVSNFWDDTKITTPAGATKNLVGGLSGTAAGTHTWGNFNAGSIGDGNYLDTWVFDTSQPQTTKAIIATSDANDFADAPDTYGTNKDITVGGIPASHLVNSNLHLGVNAPDSDSDGQPSVNADGDDINGTTPDDEDGVISFSPLIENATTYSVTVKVKNTTGAATSLGGWIDFNKDGQFQPSEGVVQSVPNNTNSDVTLTWSGLSGLTAGDMYARFRLNSDPLTTSDFNGGGRDGEVEDYKLAIQGVDYGDAPSSFGNAGHVIPTTPTLYLGSVKPDKELGTQLGADAGATAAGDDGNGTPDDEDAFTTLANVSTVGNYNLTVPVTNTSGGAATLHAWVDFNKNGKFELGEYKNAAVANNSTNASLNWAIPIGTLPGNTHVRFRLTTDNTLTDNPLTATIDERSIGNATNGEVEDYPVSISASVYDYGDAPDAAVGTGTGNYQTTALDGGAAQVKINIAGQVLSLGSNIDTDDGSLQNATALADDTSGTTDDEDGVSSFPTLTTTANQTYTVPVSVQNNVPLLNAHLVGYIDFNKDGDFNDTGEKSATVTVPTNSTNPRSFNVTFTTPAGMTTGNTYARFRLGSVQATAESATGASLSTDYGEIEDYQIAIAQARDYGDAPDSYGTNSTNNSGEGIGANHIITNTIKLGSNPPDSETDAQAPFDGTGDGTDEDAFTTLANTPTIGNYELTVPVTNTSGDNVTLHGWIDFDQDGKFESGEHNSVSVIDGATSANLIWAVPSGTTPGNTYVRFRLTSSTLTDNGTTTQDERSIGNANDGEVEDYKIAIAANGNPDLPPDFCQTPSRNLLFILDDSGSVADPLEVQQQRDAVMATLNSFVAKNLTGQAAIVGFDGVGRTVINYTNITAANLATFQTALNTNYGVPGGGTNWEAGFQAGTALGVNQPDVVFFFTDGAQTSGGSPTDEATQFKNAGAHIYGIGVDGLTIDSGFKPITDGDNTAAYNGSNVLEADFLPITDYSTLQNQFTNAFLANLCPADFGDAPDTYGTDNIVDNNSSTNPLGANHAIVSGLFLGTTAPDADANGFVDGIEDNSNATDDDALTGTGTGNGDDENNFTLPTLTAGDTSYTIPANNITATNTTTQSATLHAWIDFNKDGKFELIEYASATVNQGTTGGNPAANLTWSGISVGTVGNTYVRLRLTSDNSINNTTPGNAASNGEVEDYQIAIAQPVASNPKLLLVKRITAINPGQPDDEIQFDNTFVDDATLNDNNSNWPDSNSDPSINKYLRGAINVPDVKPGDEVEYTIYFLSNGDADAKNVNICDVVPDNMTFNKNSYGTEVGIGLGLNTTNPADSINIYLSNFIKNPINNHQGNFYPPGTNPPLNLCKKHDPNDTDNLIPHTLIPVNDSSNNLSGVVLIKLNTPLPPATAPGTPANSYGFIRFRAKVK